MQWKAKIVSMQSACWNSEVVVPVSVVTEKSETVLWKKAIVNVAEQVFPVDKEVAIERQFHMWCSSLLWAFLSKLLQSVCHVNESIVGVGEVIQKKQIIEQVCIEAQ